MVEDFLGVEVWWWAPRTPSANAAALCCFFKLSSLASPALDFAGLDFLDEGDNDSAEAEEAGEGAGADGEEAEEEWETEALGGGGDLNSKPATVSCAWASLRCSWSPTSARGVREWEFPRRTESSPAGACSPSLPFPASLLTASR